MRRLVLGSVVVLAACVQGVDGNDAGGAGGAGGVGAAGGAGGGAAISDAGPEAVDAGPSCTPASERPDWKLKFVFLFEQSGTMCIADPPGSQESSGFCEQAAAAINSGSVVPARVRAMNDFLRAVGSRPDVRVAVVPFESNLKGVYPPTGFARPDDANLQNRVWSLQTELGRHANLQGALEQARARIEYDVLQGSDATRTRTRYVVVVLSTGVPSPRCNRNDLLMPYATAARPELVWADTDTTFCNDITSDIPPAERIMTFVPGTTLNQNSQLFDLADALGAMKGWYGVSVSVHTRLLLSDSSLTRCGALCDGQLTNGLSPQDSRTVGGYVMGELARRSGGSFVDPGEPSNLSLQDLATMEPTTFCPE
jgi:hypothetical protein